MSAATASPLHALVTGATRGLGHAIALRLLSDGNAVTMLARPGADFDRVSSDLQHAHGAKFAAIACDLSSLASIEAAARKLLDQAKPPQILINNAAVQGPIGAFEAITWEDWMRTVVVDLLAPARLSQMLIPAMRQSGWGRIINISGGGATGPRPHFSAYAIAKCALVRLTETLAVELNGSGVTVNAVAPGPMNTRMLEEVLNAGPQSSGEYAAALQRQAGGGHSPEPAAALVSWLASPASDGITGRLISAVWDRWEELVARREELAGSDIYTLRRIVPADRGKDWGSR